MFLAWSALFSGVFELLLFIGAVAVVYQIFVSDWVTGLRSKRQESKAQLESIEKIAMVKLVSDDRKDIEAFVTANAQYLSNVTIQKFVARLESLKIDDVIRDDDLLKKRIADLPNNTQAQAEAEAEEDAQTTRSQRTSN